MALEYSDPIHKGKLPLPASTTLTKLYSLQRTVPLSNLPSLEHPARHPWALLQVQRSCCVPGCQRGLWSPLTVGI